MSSAAHTTEPLETVELRISARPENLSLARLALVGVAETVGAPDDLVAELKVAVTEACTNAIQHAYQGSGDDAEIVVRYTIGVEAVRVEVEDTGPGFDPASPLHGSGRNGKSAHLGLVIIAALTDELSITRGHPGTRISFSRRLSPGG